MRRARKNLGSAMGINGKLAETRKRGKGGSRANRIGVGVRSKDFHPSQTKDKAKRKTVLVEARL